MDDAQRKLTLWRQHYNRQRPLSALDDRTPAALAIFIAVTGQSAPPSLTRIREGIYNQGELGHSHFDLTHKHTDQVVPVRGGWYD